MAKSLAKLSFLFRGWNKLVERHLPMSPNPLLPFQHTTCVFECSGGEAGWKCNDSGRGRIDLIHGVVQPL